MFFNKIRTKGTIGNFSKKFHQNNRAQGTIEYLIIIAIVVVIALVVVGILTGFFATGSGVTTTQQTINQQTQQLALLDIATTPDGEYILQIKSNELDPITISKIAINGEDQNYYSNNTLTLGDEIIFPLFTTQICNNGTNITTKTIVITYTQKGIRKTHTYTNINTPCQDYELSSTSNQALIIPTDPKPTYTIIYNGNGNTSGSAPVDSTEYETDSVVIILGQENLEKTGYTFLNWNTQQNGSGTSYSLNDEITIITNIILYAQWQEEGVETFTVTFDSQGGNTIDAVTGIEEGDTITLPQQPTKAGYTFLEWNTNADGSGIELTSSTQVTQNITVYAQWEEDGLEFSCDETPAGGYFCNGSGTEEDPYGIATCEQLQNISEYLDASYILLRNIDCIDIEFNPIGDMSTPFTGSMDGDYFKIQNLEITNLNNVENIGLFGVIENATISKLVLENSVINAFRYIGPIAGTAQNSTISECGSTLDVTTGAFERGLHFGGIVGRLEGGIIEKCYAQGTINSAGYGSGGIVGYLIGGIISDCYVNGNLTAAREGSGGIAGGYNDYSISEINNSYSRGTVSAGYQGYAAGLVSSVWNTAHGLTVNDSFSIMTVNGSNKGGLVSSSYATVNNSFYTTTGSFNYGTFVDDPDVFLDDTHAVYSEWDFIDTWTINPEINDGYPYLQWENEIN